MDPLLRIAARGMGHDSRGVLRSLLLDLGLARGESRCTTRTRIRVGWCWVLIGCLSWPLHPGSDPIFIWPFARSGAYGRKTQNRVWKTCGPAVHSPQILTTRACIHTAIRSTKGVYKAIGFDPG
jgi:hypothetical protein